MRLRYFHSKAFKRPRYFRLRAVLFLFWTFMGVALGADAFMTSIETITSQTRITTVTIRGEKKRFHTRVWNDTVANLTLMALGSSAPEILLSVIEIVSSGFFAGELGPSTIVGSAAFNLLVICAVCIVAIPAGEARPRPRAPPRRRPPALAPLDLIGRLPPPLAPPTAS